MNMNQLTINEYNVDEVVSVLQKSIRRGLVEDTIRWGLELFDSYKSKLFNRLLVISVEDIGPADTNVVLIVYNIIHNNPSRISIANCLKIMAESQKTRINDWLICISNRSNKLLESDPYVLGELLKDNLQKYNAIVCHSICRALCESTQYVYTNGRYRKSQYMIWIIFKQVIENNLYVNIMEKIAMTNNWKWSDKCRLLYSHIINIWCYCDDFPDGKTKFDIITIDDTINIDFNDYKEIPDYALDKHTKRGRSMGRNLKHFIESGPCELYNIHPDWKDIDMNYKNMLKVLI